MRIARKGFETTSASDFIPPGADLKELRGALQQCKGCDLYRYATQAVFGEGSPHARVVMIGEAPGNVEDKKGKPFVGPAGGVLQRGIRDAGLDPADIYITNAVKHFKFIETRHYRLHRNPSGLQINACRPWLEAELDLIKPEILICLGSVAARSMLRRPVKVHDERGVLIKNGLFSSLLITVHPSSILRMTEGHDAAFKDFVSDLKVAQKFLASKHAVH